MVLHAASAVARRRVASMATQQIQRRNMGSGPKPEWTGIDKTVRNIFPEDWQLEFRAKRQDRQETFRKIR